MSQSGLTYNEKHPIVLPKWTAATKLLVRHVHQLALHGGVSATLSQLKMKYWIIQGRQLVKKVILGCLKCQRFDAKPIKQDTAPLPADRVNHRQPFEVTGVDFTGLMLIKESVRGITKLNIAVFVSATTRAIYLEIVDNCKTEGCSHAFRRFTARRDLCRTIYRDNARTFKRANKKINHTLKEL